MKKYSVIERDGKSEVVVRLHDWVEQGAPDNRGHLVVIAVMLGMILIVLVVFVIKGNANRSKVQVPPGAPAASRSIEAAGFRFA